MVVFAGVAQALATRFGIRWVMTTGLTLAAVSIVLYARLPVGGHYFWDLFPVFILSGVGLALCVRPDDDRRRSPASSRQTRASPPA